MFECFAQESRYQNYTHSAPQTASGSAFLAAPTPPSHSSPLWGIISRLTNTKAKALRFSSSSAFSFRPVYSLLSGRRRVPTSVRHAPLGGNNQRRSRIQDSARRPSVAAELAGVPAASQSESDPNAPLFARREMNEDAQ